MNLRRGQDWGEPGTLPAGSAVVATDHELARLASSRPGAVVGLTGGDLHRTLGGRRRDERDLLAHGGTRLAVDLGEVHLLRSGGDRERRTFAAHAVVRRGRGPRFWRPTTVYLNAAFIGEENLGPRAHPGDGLLDVLEGSLGGWDLLRSARRRRDGTHVPHPGLTQRRVRRAVTRFDRPARVEIDGVPAGRAIEVEVSVLPGAATVIV